MTEPKAYLAETPTGMEKWQGASNGSRGSAVHD